MKSFIVPLLLIITYSICIGEEKTILYIRSGNDESVVSVSDKSKITFSEDGETMTITTDEQSLKFTTEEIELLKFAISENGNIEFIENEHNTTLFFDSNGNLIFNSINSGNHQLQVFNAEGKLVSPFGLEKGIYFVRLGRKVYKIIRR